MQEDADPCQSRQAEGLYDRGNGMSGRLYGRSRYERASCEGGGRAEEISEEFFQAASAKGAGRCEAGLAAGGRERH